MKLPEARIIQLLLELKGELLYPFTPIYHLSKLIVLELLRLLNPVNWFRKD